MTLEDVHFRNRAAHVVSAKEATITIDLVSVLAKEIRIKSIVLKHPVIVVEREPRRPLQLREAAGGRETLPARDWPDVSVSDGSIVYVDKRFGTQFEGRDCHMQVRRLRHSGGQR